MTEVTTVAALKKKWVNNAQFQALMEHSYAPAGTYFKGAKLKQMYVPMKFSIQQPVRNTLFRLSPIPNS